MKEKVFLFETDGKKSLGFDTGIDARAFAQAKIAQFITEPGLVVHWETGKVDLWNAAGVTEIDRTGGRAMVVWGPPFEGERLASLAEPPADDTEKQNKALAAIAAWIQALLFLEAHPSSAFGANALPPQPSAALIGTAVAAGDVFFAPANLALRCMIGGGEWYIHPDLDGLESAAFTAAAMLYRVFAGSTPFTYTDAITLRQDMREENFLPARLAAPALDGRLASLIQNILGPVEAKAGAINGKAALHALLEILRPNGKTLPASCFVTQIPETARQLIEKEKAQHLKVKTASVMTRRFVTRNTALLLGSLAAVATVVLVVLSITHSRSTLPTTAGMDAVEVIETYYNAIGDLDHQLMEACVLKNAGKDDIRMVVNLFVLDKTRQAYEFGVPLIISAREWQEKGGGEVEPGVLGITDLRIEQTAAGLSVHRADIGEAYYRAEYTFWIPAEMGDEADEPETEAGRLPISYRHSDLLTLVQHKGNWRISQIQRTTLKP